MEKHPYFQNNTSRPFILSCAPGARPFMGRAPERSPCFDIEFFIQFFLLKFMFYLNLVPFFGNNLGISFEEKKSGFSIQKKLKFSRVFISKVIVFVDDLGPKCTYLYLTWKSQVQSTKYSTSTGTSTGTYFHNV